MAKIDRRMAIVALFGIAAGAMEGQQSYTLSPDMAIHPEPTWFSFGLDTIRGLRVVRNKTTIEITADEIWAAIGGKP